MLSSHTLLSHPEEIICGKTKCDRNCTILSVSLRKSCAFPDHLVHTWGSGAVGEGGVGHGPLWAPLSLWVSLRAYQPQLTVGQDALWDSVQFFQFKWRKTDSSYLGTATWAGSGSGSRQWHCSQNVVIRLWDRSTNIFSVFFSLAIPLPFIHKHITRTHDDYLCVEVLNFEKSLIEWFLIFYLKLVWKISNGFTKSLTTLI